MNGEVQEKSAAEIAAEMHHQNANNICSLNPKKNQNIHSCHTEFYRVHSEHSFSENLFTKIAIC